MIQFETGKKYGTTSIGDSNAMSRWLVVSRTAKTVTLQHQNQVRKRGIYVHEGVEGCKPEGKFAMCPHINADKSSEGPDFEFLTGPQNGYSQ